MITKILLKVSETGNSFPNVGDLVYHNDENKVYVILQTTGNFKGYTCGRIFTGNPGDNDYCYMVAQYYGEPADPSDPEFEKIFPCSTTYM